MFFLLLPVIMRIFVLQTALGLCQITNRPVQDFPEEKHHLPRQKITLSNDSDEYAPYHRSQPDPGLAE